MPRIVLTVPLGSDAQICDTLQDCHGLLFYKLSNVSVQNV